MKSNILKISAIAIATILMSLQVSAASFVKYDGVDGESKDHKPVTKVRQLDKSSTRSAASQPTKLLDKSSPQAASLLLPAVQKVRNAASKTSMRKVSRKKPKPQVQQSAKRKGNIEYNWKVEKGEK